MKLRDYRLIFIGVSLIGVLVIASPSLASIFNHEVEEHYSELYLLGSSHRMQDYPSDVLVGQKYSVYLDVTNHMGNSEYYVLYTDFNNQSGQLLNGDYTVSNQVPHLLESRFALKNGENWENKLTFSVTNASFSKNQSIIYTICINSVEFEVNKPATWNTNSTSFSYQLLFDLWLYDSQAGSMKFNERYVDLQLNLTWAGL